MKVSHITPCKAPRCKDAAQYEVRLDSGRLVTSVCNRHLSWGKLLGTTIENH